jgi:ribosomal silencing factor RsfS
MSELNVNLETLLAIIDANHAVDVVVIDVKDQTSITDYMIVCSGRSSRQVKALAERAPDAARVCRHLAPEMKPCARARARAPATGTGRGERKLKKTETI